MEKEANQPVVVPHSELPTVLLRSVLESFVLREGTDYGEHELTLDAKVGRLMRQLERGDAQILFDPESESVTIVPGAPRPR